MRNKSTLGINQFLCIQVPATGPRHTRSVDRRSSLLSTSTLPSCKGARVTSTMVQSWTISPSPTMTKNQLHWPWSTTDTAVNLNSYQTICINIYIYFNTIFVSIHAYVPICTQEPRRNLSNRRLNEHEHGIYIRHCQESNSQPVPSQAGADPTRPQWRIIYLYLY